MDQTKFASKNFKNTKIIENLCDLRLGNNFLDITPKQ